MAKARGFTAHLVRVARLVWGQEARFESEVFHQSRMPVWKRERLSIGDVALPPLPMAGEKTLGGGEHVR